MYRITAILSLLTLISAAGLQASPFSYLKPEGFYISSTASISTPNDSEINAGGTSGEVELNNGFGITAAVGHHIFDSARVELEYSYRTNDVDKYANFGGGKFTAQALMVNFYYDVNINYHFFWYGGAGIGGAQTRLKLGPDSDTDLVFAHQFMTGFGYRLSKQTSFLAGYRIFHTLKQDYDIGGVNYNHKGPWQHIFEIGLRYDF